MKKSIIAFVLVLVWGIHFVNADVYKWKAQTGEIRYRKDGTTYHVWDRLDISKSEFNRLLNTDFKDARVIKREEITNYIIEKDGKQIVLTDIADGHVAGKGES